MAKPSTIREYIAGVPETHRASLKHLHATIKKLYPKAEEVISYGMPAYKLDGHFLCSIRSAKTHNGFFPWSGNVLNKAGVKDLVRNYSTGMGTIRFAPDHKLPLKVVKAVLAARKKEMDARWGKKK